MGDPADCGLLSSSQKSPEGACHPQSLQTRSGARFPKFHRNVKARDPLEALSPAPACPELQPAHLSSQILSSDPEQPDPQLSAHGDGRSCHGTAMLTPMGEPHVNNAALEACAAQATSTKISPTQPSLPWGQSCRAAPGPQSHARHERHKGAVCPQSQRCSEGGWERALGGELLLCPSGTLTPTWPLLGHLPCCPES